MAKTLYTFQADLKQLDELQRKLKAANRELEKMKASSTSNQAAVRNQANSVKTLNNQLDGTKRKAMQVSAATQQVTGAGRSMANVFKSAAIAIASAFTVRAIVGGIRGMINSFKEFESRMAAVKAISGATNEQFVELEKSALQLGRTTVYSAAQIAKLQEEFARLGFTTEQILQAQEATIDLAAATGEDLSNAAATAGSVLKAFGYEATQTQRIVDVMAASFTGSALNLERFTESMKFVAPIARNVGFTIEETTAMMMKLADAGLSGSIAGNALKNIFLDLGNSGSKLAKHIGGPVNSLDDLVVVLEKLEDQSFGATQAAELLNKRATPAFLTLIANADGLQKVAEDLIYADGAAREMAAIRLDTLSGDIVLMQSAMEGLGIALTDTFDITFRQIIDSFTRFLQAFADSEGALNTFRTTISTLTTALILYVGTLGTVKLGTILVTGVKKIFYAVMAAGNVVMMTARGGALGYGVAMSVLTTRMKAATGKATLFKAVMASTPWGLLALGVSALVVGFTGLGDELDSVTMQQNRLSREWDKSLGNLAQLTEGTKEYNDAIVKIVKDYSPYFKWIDLEIQKKERILELDAQLAGATDEKGQLMMDELQGLIHLSENYDKYTMSVKVHAEQTFAALKEFAENNPDNPLAEFVRFAPTADASVEQIIGSFRRLTNALNAIETSRIQGEEYFKFGLDPDFVKASGEEIINDSEFMVYARDYFEEGGFMDEFFNMATERVDRNSTKFKTKISKAFELDQGWNIMGTVDVSTLIPEFKLLGTEEYFSFIPESLEQVRKDIVALTGELNKEVGLTTEGELVTIRQQIRTDYLKDLEEFRDIKDIEAQKDRIALIENLTETAELTKMYMEIVAENELEGGVESVAAQQFLQRQADKGEAITKFIDLYNLKWIDAANNHVNIAQTIGIETTELQRHLEDLQNNLRKSSASTKKITNDTNKWRVKKTKDMYKELLQAQAEFFSDELRAEEEQANARRKFENKDLQAQIKMNYANIADIQKLKEELKAGIDAGEYINTKAVIKNYEILSSFSEETLQDFLNIGKNGGDAMRGVTTEIMAQIITVGEDGSYIIEERAMTLHDVLDEMLEEERNKMMTNLDIISQNADSFERQLDRFAQNRLEATSQAQEDYYNAIIEAEARIGRVLESDGENLAGNNRWTRGRDAMEKMYNAERDALAANHAMRIKHSEEDEAIAISRAQSAGATAAEITAIETSFQNEREKMTNEFNAGRIENEEAYAMAVEESIKSQISMYADLYNQAFEIFSMAMTNSIDVQLQRDRAYLDERLLLLQDNLDAELALHEGNAEAQENIRAVYAEREDVLQDQIAEKETAAAKKKFKMEKANSIVQAIINGALAMTKVTADTGVLSFVFNPIVAALIAAQIAVIASQQFVGKKGGIIPQFAKGGLVHGPSHAQGGVKFNAGGRVVELEGGEAVINKRSTSMFHKQLSAMNVAGGGKSFADGGLMPGTSNRISGVGTGMNLDAFAHNIVKGINEKQITVTESDISQTQNSVAVAEATSSLF